MAQNPSPLILVAPLPPPYTGQSLSFQMLVDYLAERGIQHSVVNLTGSRARTKAARAAEYARILWRFWLTARRRSGTVYLTIAQSREGFFRDFAIIRLAKHYGHRIVVHLKGGNYGVFYATQPTFLQRVIRSTLRHCDSILVLGERLRAMYDFEPCLAPKIRVVPNGLPDRNPLETPTKTIPDPRQGPIRILFLSNLIESKGWIDLLAAMSALRARFGDGRIHCEFCGEFQTNPVDDVRVQSVRQARDLFDSIVVEERLQNDVAWLGSVTGDEKRAKLASAHFFVLPTQYSNEGQPVSIIEAMAYGTVVISTDYRAIPDLVQDNVTGRLVPFNDPTALADAIGALIDSPAQYTAMSAAAAKRYRERFTRTAHLRTILPHLVGEPARE